MCGITGYYNSNKDNIVSEFILKNMLRRLYHRGPDESGIYLENHVGLGHARLRYLIMLS